MKVVPPSAFQDLFDRLFPKGLTVAKWTRDLQLRLWRDDETSRMVSTLHRQGLVPNWWFYLHKFAGHVSVEADVNGLCARLCDFSGSRWVLSTLQNWHLSSGEFGGAEFHATTFCNCSMVHTKVWGDWRGTRFLHSSFTGTAIQDAIFHQGQFSSCSFLSGTIHNTDFRDALFVRCTFFCVEFVDVDFSGVDLRDTQFQMCRLHRPTYDHRTRWPKDFDRKDWRLSLKKRVNR